MLKEIRCEKFNEPVITFDNGLNVVLGDENATNSIGKSILLMVIDFVFGGNDFLNRNTDVVTELGHHEYYFKFLFNDEYYFFRRGTNSPNLVYKCSPDYEEIEPIALKDFTAFLKASYSITAKDITFREFVGIFSRIWPKDNLTVSKPLHIVSSKSPAVCIDNLIKAFNKYDSIKALALDLKKKEEDKSALNRAFKNKIIPKITKTQYNKNESRIKEIESEIEDIKSNLAKYAINIREIVNREIMELKVQKDEMLRVKLILDSKLKRIQNNLSENKHINSKHLNSLKDFFPEVNIDKLAEIEVFHSDLSKILKKELQSAEKELLEQLKLTNSEINRLDKKISETLSSLENPSVIVDRVYELSSLLQTSKTENNYYLDATEIKNSVKNIKAQVSEEKERILELLEYVINEEIQKTVSVIYDKSRKSPTLFLKGNNYTYEVFEDTGTGTAYSNLLIFDLSIFSLTSLPFLIHDSLLFKNIENDAVANLIKVYSSFSKQSFVAIDEIEKYGKVAAQALTDKSVIKLSDSRVLYIKDWRKR